MEEYVLTVPQKQDVEIWFKFINESRCNTENIKLLIVDFNFIGFLNTDNFVVLACLIECFTINGSTVEMKGGTDKFNRHLDNIKFKKYWDNGFNRERFTPALNSTTLCLWKISQEMIYSYSTNAKNYFKQGNLKEKNLTMLSASLDELFNNIFDHSKSSVMGYIITQYFPASKILSFSICDFGVGIPNSINTYNIKESNALLTDSQALLKATTLGFSVRSTPKNRGLGLNNLVDFIDNNEGKLTILSNDGMLFKESNKNCLLNEMGYNFFGTLIKVELNATALPNADNEEDNEQIFGF